MSFLNNNNDPTRTNSKDYRNPSRTITGDNNSDPSRTTIDDDPSRTHNNNSNPRRRGGTGRRKIEIKKIEDKKRRIVAFWKRKKTLFKKVNDLTEECNGVKAAVITFSPTGNPYAYGSPSVNSVVSCYLDQMKVKKGGGKWWEKPIEGMSREELQTFKEDLIKFGVNLEERVQEINEREAKTINFLDGCYETNDNLS